MHKVILVVCLLACLSARASPIKGSIFTFTPWTPYNPPLIFEYDAANDSLSRSFNATGSCPEGNKFPGVLFDPEGVYDPNSNELLILNMILVQDQPQSFWSKIDLSSGSVKCAKDNWGSAYAYLRWMVFDEGRIYGIVQNPYFYASFAIVDTKSDFKVTTFSPLSMPGNASTFCAGTAYDSPRQMFYAVLFNPTKVENMYLASISIKTGVTNLYPIQNQVSVLGITVEPNTGHILALGAPDGINATLGTLSPSSDKQSYVFTSLPASVPLELLEVGGGQLFIEGDMLFAFTTGGNCQGLLCQWLLFYDYHTGKLLKVEDARVYMGNDYVGNGDLGPHVWVPSQ